MNVRVDGSEYDVNFWMSVDDFVKTVSTLVDLLEDPVDDNSEIEQFQDIVLEDISDYTVRDFMSTIITIKNVEILDALIESVLKQSRILLTIPGFCITDYQEN